MHPAEPSCYSECSSHQVARIPLDALLWPHAAELEKHEHLALLVDQPCGSASAPVGLHLVVLVLATADCRICKGTTTGAMLALNGFNLRPSCIMVLNIVELEETGRLSVFNSGSSIATMLDTPWPSASLAPIVRALSTVTFADFQCRVRQSNALPSNVPSATTNAIRSSVGKLTQRRTALHSGPDRGSRSGQGAYSVSRVGGQLLGSGFGGLLQCQCNCRNPRITKTTDHGLDLHFVAWRGHRHIVDGSH